MLGSMRIGAIVFNVADIDRTEAFYRDTLGLKLDRMPGEPGESGGADWLMGQDAGGVSLIFFQAPGTRGDSPIPMGMSCPCIRRRICRAKRESPHPERSRRTRAI